MRFASFILALSAAAATSASAIVERGHYYPTFLNLDAATEAPGYLTYRLVSTAPDCFAACDAVAGCNFVNIYNDVNGKNGSTELTCSMYTACQYSNTATNKGGQTQPDGTVDYITNSDGWCKTQQAK